jgi:ribosomal-protein-alanine N-acetyltransferase
MFEPKDLDEVIIINRKCLPENYSRFFLMNLHSQFPKTFLVIEAKGIIVGYIITRIEKSFPRLSLKKLGLVKKGHVISIAVLPEYRNKGLGSMLIDRAVNSMKKYYNVIACFLEVRVSNKEALALYAKKKFRVQKTVTSYYSDGEDAYIMNRDI